MKFLNGQQMEKFLKIPLLSTVILITVSGCSSLANSPSNTPRTAGAEWELKEGSVYDGDTFRVIHSQTGEELKIRMACIDAPEKKQPLGINSRDYLRSLLNQNPQKIILSVAEKDRYGRSVAEVYIQDPKNPQEEIPVNALMIKSGMAYFYRQYDSACKGNSPIYAQLEEQAKAERAGVWSGNHQKPWEYRKSKRD